MGILRHLNELTSDPLGFLVETLYLAAAVLISLILHECAHGYVALRCGDPTAKMMGRLSLNPARHLDPIGTASMLLFGFGWAKPVPVNPRNFRGNYRRDDFLVSIAGITVNFGLFLLFSGLSVVIGRLMWQPELLENAAEEGLSGHLFNPYAYSLAAVVMYPGGYMNELATMVTSPIWLYVQRFVLLMAQINLSLAIFNFLPIPPLDGYHLLNDLLLKGRFTLDQNTFRIAQAVLMVLLLTGALTNVLSAANEAVFSFFVNIWLAIAGG